MADFEETQDMRIEDFCSGCRKNKTCDYKVARFGKGLCSEAENYSDDKEYRWLRYRGETLVMLKRKQTLADWGI